MTTRYFKATDGKITVFRASKTRVYQSASGFGPKESISFSGRPGPFPTTEISKAEYDALVVVKAARIASRWATKYPGEAMPSWAGSSPQDSWVDNPAIAGAA